MIGRLRTDDRGTSLLIVLMIITFVSTVTGVILSQESTSMKATQALQEASSGNYGADAAGKAVVTQLNNGQFACTTPAASTLNLGNGLSNPFYSPVGSAGGPQNAVATCAPDTTTGANPLTSGTGLMVGPTNTPSAAITSVGPSVLDGIIAVTPTSLCVQGSVLSYTAITGIVTVGKSSTGIATACPDTVDPGSTIKAFGNPIPIIPGCLGIFLVTPCTPLGTSVPAIPTVPAPTLSITAANTNQPAVCQTSGSKTYAAFLPGLYTQVSSSTASSLNTPCKSGSKWVVANVEWFTPGVYYFNFGSTTWSLPAALVGGTPAKSNGQPITGLNPASATTLAASTLSNLSQMPTGEGKCVPPTGQTQPAMGVEFVFGGASTMTITTPNFLGLPTGPSTDLNICATYSATSPPVAIYGVYQTSLVRGSATIPAESGCVTTPVGTLGCLTTQSLINTSTPPIGDQTYHIDGYVWAPAAAMTTSYLSATGQAFNWGVLVRTFQVAGLPIPSVAMASLPAVNAGVVTTYTYTIRYVNVWTCAAASSPCPQTGPPDLHIKLQQTGSTWKVLSWSQQR